MTTAASRFEAAIRQAATYSQARPLVVGLCGAQGSGKTTLAHATAANLNATGLRTVVLALDDLYLPLEARQSLAAEIHPLLRTRGVPGTHDTELGETLLRALAKPEPTALPSFDKATDTRLARAQWPTHQGPFDIIIFEGWMVGATPQPAQALATPVNDLERVEDPHATWRTYANDQLAGPYRHLFHHIHCLVLLAAPSFATVFAWRQQQEEALHHLKQTKGAPRNAIMDEVALRRFVAHYQRLTEHILQEMPSRAHLVLRLNSDRSLR